MSHHETAAGPTTAVVGSALPHESAALHVAGQAPYVDDLPELNGTLHAALGLSPVAHGRLDALQLDALRQEAGVVAILTANDIPGLNDCGPIVHDDPILAQGELRFVGQPVFAVIATTRLVARRVAARAKEVIQATPLPALLDVRQGHAQGQYVVPPMHLTREQSPEGWQAAMKAAPHRLKGQWSLGGQEQFYLEGQISYAVPTENNGMLVHCSTQHPSEMQHAVAHALGWASHQVRVVCRRMGGGFGGKESQSAQFACIAALAAQQLQRPVKLRVDRDDDFLITGRRHCFEYDYEVGFDGEGRILAAEVTMMSRAGHSADLSAPVMTRALCHFDNAYWLPNVAMHGYSVRTNTQSNTAFRGFGGPQGAMVMENIIDSVARHLQRDALDVRRINFYAEPDSPAFAQQSTPYGQPVLDNVLQPLVAQLEASSRYRARRAEVEAFNAKSPVLKRGLALTPVKFGIAFNLKHLNQAGALVHVYADGSILVNHGGTEMGQGLNTKVAQVVAEVFGVPLSTVRVSATDTDKVANTSATAASTGSDLNGQAAHKAAMTIRTRLATLLAERAAGVPEEVVFAGGAVVCKTLSMLFAELVTLAYTQRVQLWSDGFYATPGLHWNPATLQGHPFHYFAYGAAVAEVLVDTLTGEHRLLQADLLHDAGRSLNPALDIGQVEGAFIQGLGWLTSEELYWQPLDGSPKAGLLMTHAPSTYKIPTANDVPEVFNTQLFDNPRLPSSIHQSKAVGEPPLLLAFSVFFALRDAISATCEHQIDPPLRAPATPEAVLDALDAVRQSRA